MKGKAYTPYIHINKDRSVEIIGDPDGLKALGEMLIQKAKLGKNMSATFSDGVNPKIHITTLRRRGD